MADTRVWLLTADEAAALRDAGSAAELDAVMRPIRDRLAVEVLEQAVASVREHEQWLRGHAADHVHQARVVGVGEAAAVLTALAAEYREGKR